MAVTKLAPLSTQVPIVDPVTGNPTPYFQNLLQILLKEKGVTENTVADNVTDLASLAAVVAALELDDLTDVDTTATPPTDGQALVYDTGSSLWLPGTVASGASPFRGCVARKAADQTAANYSTITTMSFDAEDYDTDSFHNTVTNNSRLTVPSGVTRIVLKAQIGTGSLNASEWVFARILKNGSTFSGGPVNTTTLPTTNPRIELVSSVLNVSAGDYFELQFQVQADTSITITASETFFSIEAVENSIPSTASVWEASANGVTLPSTGAMTSWNIGTSSATTSAHAIQFQPQNGGVLRGYYQAVPTAPFDIYMRLENYNIHTTNSGYQNHNGILLRDNSDGETVGLVINSNASSPGLFSYEISRWTSVGGFVSTPVQRFGLIGQEAKWLRVNVTSTTATFYMSHNGWDWIQIGTESIAAYIDAITHYGFCAYQAGTSTGGAMISYFSTTAPV